MTGRFDAALSYADTLAMAIRDGPDAIPFGLAGLAGGVYLMIGQAER